MDSTTRRDFLKSSSSTMLGAAAISTFAAHQAFAQAKAAGPNSPVVIAVYLRGGSDPLQAIVPYGDPMYYEIRPTIAIPREDNKNNKGILKLDNLFGFHPSMAPLMDIYNAGHLAPIVNVGSPHDTRSHFDAQDFMERAAPGVKTVTEGWLNRYLYATKQGKDNELRALAFQTLLPRSLRGQFPVLAVPDDDAQGLMNMFEGLYTCEQMAAKKKEEAAPAAGGAKPQQPQKYANQPVRPSITEEESRLQITAAGQNEIRRIREVRAILAAGKGGKYPQSRFGNQMRNIAALIKSNRGMEVAAIDYDGWDHHAYEGGSNGTFARMIGDLSAGLRAFYDEMGADRMKRIAVLVMSEFGRTARENGSQGSDHGHGGYMLAMGGAVKGKQVFGRWTGLEAENLNDRRDLPVHTDFRQVFAETLENIFNFDTVKSRFFPEYKPAAKALGLFGRVA